MRRFTLSQIASDLRFAIRITNRNRSQIAQFGALSFHLRFRNSFLYAVKVPVRISKNQNWKNMTGRDVPEVYVFFSARESGDFLHMISLLNCTENLEKQEQIHWRKFKNKIQWRRRLENCRFLSVVVVERVLTKIKLEFPKQTVCLRISMGFTGHLANIHFSGKDPLVDQSCADCPGFPVLGAGDAPPPELHPGASECAPGLAFDFWISFPTTRAQEGRTIHVFAAQGGTHTVSDPIF